MGTSRLDELEGQHREEEAREAARRLTETPRPLRPAKPKGGVLPDSSRWLDRLFDHERMVREKKPCVFDHLRSFGPWMVSVDEDPLSVLDAMSQTATNAAGFSPDPIVRTYLAGGFRDSATTAPDTSIESSWAEEALRAALSARIGPSLPHITFANSGAEANEKALALCRLQRPEADKVVAFEGAFHGRTLLALHATWNPKKRGPYEITGSEVRFAPFPVWPEPNGAEPETPSGLLEAITEAASDEAWAGLVTQFGGSEDPLMAAELASLTAVRTALQDGRVFACNVEPMQSEGGDRYATPRFFRALRLLTRVFDVPLVFDEVQTGFGLGGSFLWHTGFALVDRDGNPDSPDFIILAKRAQLGIVASRFPDPAPTSAHPASMVRGRIHAEMVTDGEDAHRVQARAWEELQSLQREYPELVSNPRCRGFALAFDLPSPAHLPRFIAQRFYRGAVVFAAGSRTIRYRLNQSFHTQELDRVFEAVRKSLAWMTEHPGETPPSWSENDNTSGQTQPSAGRPETRLRLAAADEEDAIVEQIMALEAGIFEPARRDPEYRLRMSFASGGLPILAEVLREGEWQLAGYAVACPLELIEGVDGPNHDPNRGRENTLYAIALAVDPKAQGLGLGFALKAEQVRRAGAATRDDGSPRYRWVSGRTRLGDADAMLRINRKLGGYVVEVFEGQYDDEDAAAAYYRIPTGALSPDTLDEAVADVVDPNDVSTTDGSTPLDFRGGLATPLGRAPSSLRQAEKDGLLFGAAVNKITICNYASPAIVRAVEWIEALAPQPHLFLTSSRDELIDKGLRVFRHHRADAQVAIGLEGGYVGHTTAAARSVSDPRTHRGGPGYFPWSRVPHPEAGDIEATLEALEAEIKAAGGPDRVLGVVVESCQEMTGRVMSKEAWCAFDELRDRTDIPFLVVETASAGYRSGAGPFLSPANGFTADLMAWWGGGQVGFLHTSPEYWVDKPLTMVSTWDGDELSIIRVHHHLREARKLDLETSAAAIEDALTTLSERGYQTGGLGLYRTVTSADDRAAALGRALEARAVLVRPIPDGFALVPALSADAEAFKQLHHILLECA